MAYATAYEEASANRLEVSLAPMEEVDPPHHHPLASCKEEHYPEDEPGAARLGENETVESLMIHSSQDESNGVAFLVKELDAVVQDQFPWATREQTDHFVMGEHVLETDLHGVALGVQ